MERIPEPEVMDDDLEVRAYREADFRAVNRACARRALRTASRPSGRAIDLGTGPAEIPILFCEMAPGWSVTAVDASPGMLAVARENLKTHGLFSRITLLEGDAKSLSSLRRPFDLVFSNSLLHHVEEPVSFWREVGRLVIPVFAVSLPLVGVKGRPLCMMIMLETLQPPNNRSRKPETGFGEGGS